jgi:hypothetical protein
MSETGSVGKIMAHDPNESGVANRQNLGQRQAKFENRKPTLTLLRESDKVAIQSLMQ